jgi:uroporphyrin-III C-methyltransferase
MTDTNIPKDSNNSAKESSSTKDENTQEKLAKLSASIDKDKTAKKVDHVDSKPNKKTPPPLRTNKTPATTTKNMNTLNQPKTSKTAIIALLIAIIGLAGVGVIHYLHELQNKNQSETLAQQLKTLNTASEQRLNQLLTQQKSVIDNQVNTALLDITNTSATRIEQLETQLNALKQNQPTDWLIHEAEYLIRIASRTIWLEHDTSAAINLLQDADARIKELNSPEYLPIRQLIREDIETLKLMPTLKTEEIILTLLALNKQVSLLNFAMAKIPENDTGGQSLQLSEDTADWRSNLAKTWQKFLADFITVRRREGNVEPLMSANNQQHLKENLALKLQQTQWAASEEKSVLFTQSLDDISLWLSEYFDMGHLETAKFYQSIQLLKSEIVSYDYPTKLQSLNAIRQVLTDKPVTIPQTKASRDESLNTENKAISEITPPKKETESSIKVNEAPPVKKKEASQQKIILEDA